jgi:hypothetical protein
MTKPPPRKLHRGHFAFMRALAQGIDERTAWDRYLRLEGEHTDLRVVRRTIAWIRDEFAAARAASSAPAPRGSFFLTPSSSPRRHRCRASAISRMRRDLKTSPKPSRSKPTRRPIPVERMPTQRRVQAPVARRGACASSSASSRPCVGSKTTRRRTLAPVTVCPAWLNPAMAERLERGRPRHPCHAGRAHQPGRRALVGQGARRGRAQGGAHPRLAAGQRGAARPARGLACRAPAPRGERAGPRRRGSARYRSCSVREVRGATRAGRPRRPPPRAAGPVAGSPRRPITRPSAPGSRPSVRRTHPPTFPPPNAPIARRPSGCCCGRCLNAGLPCHR